MDSLFATETMAELSARQGRLADAVAIYRHLVCTAEASPAGTPDDAARVERWKARIAELAEQPAAPARSTPEKPTVSTASAQRAALVVHELVRSGQVIYAEGRDLIVVASVHPGAQLLADGNIHVYGTLKGRAIAGARGARDAQVFCLKLESELVGVDTGYATSDDVPPDVWGGPARVLLTSEGKCAVVALPTGKRADPLLRSHE